jgi:hypothetical protein
MSGRHTWEWNCSSAIPDLDRKKALIPIVFPLDNSLFFDDDK